MTTLVTGGAGYLGSHVARTLLARGPVRVLDRRTTPEIPAAAEAIEGDLTDPELVRRSVEGVETIVHIAFVQSLSRLPESERRRINLGGMENLLAAAREAGVGRVVFASTIEIYGTRPPIPCPEDAPTDAPVGWYGRHKLACEELLFASGVPAVALRMPTICGAGFFNHRPLLALMDRILSGRAVAVVGDGSIEGDFVHVDDVADAFRRAVEVEAAAGSAFNVSAAAPASHRQALEAMKEAVGSRSAIVGLPPLVVRAALPIARRLGLSDLPPDQDGYLFHSNVYSIERARRVLGYEPRATAAEAAASLIEGYRADRERARERSRAY